jgi:CheY-like chemotaxis protein
MLRILIIEDDPALAGLISRFLSQLTTNEPIVANSMEQAMNILNEASPVDLVTLDLSLPDSTSEQTIKNRIKDIKAKQPNCLLVVITGSMKEGAELEAMKQGADGFMQKTESCRSDRTFLDTLGDIFRSIARQPVRYQKNLPLLEKLTEKICEHVACKVEPSQPQTNT